MPDFGDGLFVDVEVCALERIDGLLGVAYHQNVVLPVVGFDKNFFEDIPLECVRVLEFVNDGVPEFLPEGANQGRIFDHDGVAHVADHVVERLNLLGVFFLFPFPVQSRNVGKQAFLQKKGVDSLFGVEQALEIDDSLQRGFKVALWLFDIDAEYGPAIKGLSLAPFLDGV